MVTLSRVPSWEYGITVAGADFRARWLGNLNLSASCLNLSVPHRYPLQSGNNNHTLSERAVCEDGVLILGKCLELCLATSRHFVSGSSLLLWTEERPGSSLGLPALCPQWECALPLSPCVGRVPRPGRDTCIGWLGAECQLCLSSLRLYM